MDTAGSQPTCIPLSPGALISLIYKRTPRESAKSEIDVKVVPLRTCYETFMRLTGPRNAVLDYAAVLFAHAASRPSPAPPLAVEEAHTRDDGETLSVLLSSGLYVAA